MITEAKYWLPLKIFLYLLFFSILHFIYSLFPNPVFAIIGGIDESIFQHMKLTFYSYLLVILIETYLERDRNVLTTRLLTSFLIPWMMLAVWYLQPAFGTHIESMVVEIIYSYGVLIVVAVLAHSIENSVQMEFTPRGRYIIYGLVVLAILIFTVFSFKEPYIDVFSGLNDHDH